MSSSTTRDEFNVLITAMTKSNYDEKFVSLLSAFYAQNEDQDVDNDLKWQCDSWIIFIYDRNNKHDLAYTLVKDLLLSLPKKGLAYTNAIVTMLNLNGVLKKSQEDWLLADDFLRNGDINCLNKLAVLHCYNNILTREQKQILEKFRVLVFEIAEFLGIDSKLEMTLDEEVDFLYSENKNASRRLGDTVIKYHEAKNEEKIKILQEYIEGENIPYYKALAQINMPISD